MSIQSKRLCSIEGCERPSRKFGWCASHYAQWWVQERILHSPPCSLSKCDKPSLHRGLCELHYHRWRLYGDPDWRRWTLEERFWSKVICDLSSGCWLWTGAKDRRGYGRTKAITKAGTGFSHRESYALAYGDISDGMEVCHHCDTPLCMRPDHLFLGTQAENMTDMVSKGRHMHGDNHYLRLHPEMVRRGERSPSAKLTEAQVVDMRDRYAKGGISFAALARAVGLAPETVRHIIHRERWKHVA